MRELTKSMFSFSWALSLFGLERMSTLFAPGSRPTAGFDAVRRSTEEQLGPAVRTAFRTGDDIQRRMIDLMFGFFDWGPFLRMGSDVTRRSFGMISRASAGFPGSSTGGCSGCSGRSQGNQPPTGWGPIPPVTEAP